MKAINTLLLVTGASILLWSCGGTDIQDSGTDESASDDSAVAVSQSGLPENELADFKFHIFIANIPAPLEAFDVLKAADVPFTDGLTNDVANSSKYTTTTAIALNYGVYMADLAYFTFYEQTQQTMVYYATSRRLAEELGFADVLDRVASKRFSDNMGNQDSTKAVIDDAYIAMDDYLKSNAQLKTAGLISLGGWVESQHIAISAMGDKDNDQFKNEMLEQKLHLDNLIKFFNEFSSDADVADLLTSLNAINTDLLTMVGVEDINEESMAKVSSGINTLRETIIN